MARYGIIGDVHGNLEALHAALRAIDGRGVDAILCVGDLVGFNADGNEVVAELLRLEAITVAGNHDRIALGLLDTSRCWYKAAHALERTRRLLSEKTRAELATLPLTRSVDSIFLFHGAVDDVQRYCRSSQELARNDGLVDLASPRARLCFYGHTHTPAVAFVSAEGTVRREDLEGRSVVELDPEQRGRWFVNPGSIDAARRSDRRAQLALYDSDNHTLESICVAYDHRVSEGKARRGGYRVTKLGELRHEAVKLAKKGPALARALHRRVTRQAGSRPQ